MGKPGVLHPILDALQTQGANEYMMCADAKKVTACVDIVGGDVDMSGYEDGTSLSGRNRSLEETLRIKEIKGSFTSYLCSHPLENLPNEVKILLILLNLLVNASRMDGSCNRSKSLVFKNSKQWVVKNGEIQNTST